VALAAGVALAVGVALDFVDTLAVVDAVAVERLAAGVVDPADEVTPVFVARDVGGADDDDFEVQAVTASTTAPTQPIPRSVRGPAEVIFRMGTHCRKFAWLC
jgi:hypothetical protein